MKLLRGKCGDILSKYFRATSTALFLLKLLQIIYLGGYFMKILTMNENGCLAKISSARLETRTKEFVMCATRSVIQGTYGK